MPQHEGYANYATFDICVMFDNTRSYYDQYLREIDRNGFFTPDSVKKFVKQFYPITTPSKQSIGNVNWDEVATDFNDTWKDVHSVVTG